MMKEKTYDTSISEHLNQFIIDNYNLNDIDLNHEINESYLLKDLIDMISKIKKKRFIHKILEGNACLQFSSYPIQEPASFYVKFKKSAPCESKFK